MSETPSPGLEEARRVNIRQLQTLQESFDTSKLLEASNFMDSLGHRCDFAPEGIRNDFLRLHSMAHELINGGVPTLNPLPGETIHDLALDLSDEISDWIVMLRKIQKRLDKLVALAPEDDD